MQEPIDKVKQRLTKSDWIKILSEWGKSGEKQKAFCKKRNINYSTFVYWRMQLKKKENRIKEPSSFAAIKTIPAMVTSAFKINFPNGIYFTIPSTVDKASLKLIFELLGVSAC